MMKLLSARSVIPQRKAIGPHILGFGCLSLDTLCLVALFPDAIYPVTQNHIQEKETNFTAATSYKLTMNSLLLHSFSTDIST